MGYPLVYAQIVHWNRLNDTLECLESLCQQTYPNLHLVVIDNNSPDKGYQVIAERFPQAEILRNSKNMGAAGGYNTGLRHALEKNADYVLVLNNDTLLDPKAIELMVEACQPAEVGMVSPMVYYASEPDKIWSAGGSVSPLTLEMTDDHGRNRQFTGITERDFLTACAMLIKRPTLQKVGIFDELFFWYYDDSDLSLRVKQAGYKNLLVPQAKIWHKVSRSSGGSDSPLERYYMGLSSILFFRKHARAWQWFFIIPWRIGSGLKTLLRLFRKRRIDSVRAYLSGLWAGLRYPPYRHSKSISL